MLRSAPLLLAAGCSFVFVKGPDASPPPRCTTIHAWPIADSIIAAASIGLGVLAAMHVARYEYGGSRGDELRKETDTSAAVGLFVAGAIYTGSAGFGFFRVYSCNRGY